MKLGSLTWITSVIFTFTAICLIALNYWHASKCGESSQSVEEMNKYIESLKRRILQAETQSMRNTILLNKIIDIVQKKMYKFEVKELEALSQFSKDDAIRITLELGKHPVSPMPDFELDKKYKDKEKLADMIDDWTKEAAADDYVDSYGFSDNKKKTKKNKSSTSSSSFDDYDSKTTLTDAESTKLCSEWKTNYSVVTGVSWGNLPYDLQQKWIQYSCDYHLPEDGEITKK